MAKKLIEYIGRDYKTFDCFDLVREFYKDQFDIDLSHYYEGKANISRDDIQTLIVSNKGDFDLVAEPAFGDIVVIALFGLQCHIGVCVGTGMFLHSRETTGSVLDKLDRYSKMIAGYYRHKVKA